MGFSSAMLWWEEWQLRILVLASLFIQYLLFFSPWMRRVHVLRRLRVLVWIAYIASDAVAIYALATLFNRQARTYDGKSSAALEVLWAPFLLIHLGGHMFISAYSLEDNELWKRHTVTLVCQVTVALYVFCKWWSGEKKLLAAAILLFVVGILKFAAKPWALRTASFHNTFNILPAGHTAPVRQRMHSLQEYVQAVKEGLLENLHSGPSLQGMRSRYVFIDQSAPYSLRIENLLYFQTLEFKSAFDALQSLLAHVFTRMYTQVASFRGVPGLIQLFILLPAPIVLASTLLFATSRNDGHNEKDLWVTYIIFCCTTVLEFLPLCMSIFSLVPCLSSLCKPFDTQHVFVSQHNILSFYIRKNNPTLLMKLATFNFLREFVNQHLYIQQVPIAYQITETVHRHLEDCWRKYIHDTASYRRSSELRGQWAIRRHPQLGWSLKRRFDETVVMWHVATDLCFYHTNTSAQCRREEATQRSRQISNYMIYLLLKRPEMLMPGTKSGLFISASEKIVVDNSETLANTEENLAREILNRSNGLCSESEDVIYNACMLARALMALNSEEERWTVIQGVWVEMLCYSASRCRGYLHAKSLGDGGECLTLISLLLYLMGMGTYADRNQRSELSQEEEDEPWTSPSHGRSDPPQDEEDEEEEEEPQASQSQDTSNNRSAEDLSPV